MLLRRAICRLVRGPRETQPSAFKQAHSYTRCVTRRARLSSVVEPPYSFNAAKALRSGTQMISYIDTSDRGSADLGACHPDVVHAFERQHQKAFIWSAHRDRVEMASYFANSCPARTSPTRVSGRSPDEAIRRARGFTAARKSQFAGCYHAMPMRSVKAGSSATFGQRAPPACARNHAHTSFSTTMPDGLARQSTRSA